MKPSHIGMFILCGLGVAWFWLPAGKEPEHRIPTKHVAKRKHKRKHHSLRLRRRYRSLSMRVFQSKGPFLYYTPKQPTKQQWKLNKRLHFKVHYKATIHLNLALLPLTVRKKMLTLPKQTHKYELRGNLHLQAKRKSRSLTYFAAQMAAPMLSQDGVTVPLPEGFKTVYWFRVDGRGRFSRFRFSHKHNKLARQMLREITTQLSFPLPTTYQGNGWTLQNNDEQGEFSSKIQWLKRGQGKHGKFDFFMRKKLPYTKLRKQEFVHKIKLYHSLFRIKVKPHSYGINTINGRESYAYLTKQGGAWMRSSFFVQLSRIERDNTPLDLWTAKYGRRVTHQRTKYKASSVAQVSSPYRSLEGALQAFYKLIKTSKYEGLKALADFLKANPSQCQQLADDIKNKTLPKNKHGILIHALELTGTPEAQDALVAIMTDTQHQNVNRTRAIVASNGMKSPTPKLVDTLWSLHKQGRVDKATNAQQSRASTALLALGGIVRANKRAAQLRKQLRDKLHRALQQSRTATQRRTVLIAIRNAAEVASGTLIKPYLQDPSPLVREAAAAVFSKLQPMPHSLWLAAQLMQEKIPQVQSRLLSVLVQKNTSLRQVIHWIYRNITGRSLLTLREAAIHYLGKSLRQFPQNKAFLEKLGRQESSPVLIRQIYTYILTQ